MKKKTSIKVKRLGVSDLEWIILCQTLHIPDYIIEHPKFNIVRIIDNPYSDKIRNVKHKIRKIFHYCEIEINDIIRNGELKEIQKNPYYLNYTYPSVTSDSDFNNDECRKTRLYFWIPTEKQQDKYGSKT